MQMQMHRRCRAGTAVICGDAKDITNRTVGDCKECLSALENQYSIAAFYFSKARERSGVWTVQHDYLGAYTGSFTLKTNDGGLKLETPVCFVGNELDPMASL